MSQNNLTKEDICIFLSRKKGYSVLYSKKIINNLIEIFIDEIKENSFNLKNIGTFKILKIIEKASTLLKSNGRLILEIGYDQKIKIISLLKKRGFYINNIIKDYAKNDRCVISTKIN